MGADQTVPNFEREKWKEQLQLEREKLELAKRDQDNKDLELAIRNRESARSRWNGPVAVALISAVVAGAASVVGIFLNAQKERDQALQQFVNSQVQLAAQFLVSQLQARQQFADSQILARQQFQASLVLQAVKTGNLQCATKNLHFLLDAGLIDDTQLGTKLSSFLKKHPYGAAVLPAEYDQFSNWYQRHVIDTDLWTDGHEWHVSPLLPVPDAIIAPHSTSPPAGSWPSSHQPVRKSNPVLSGLSSEDCEQNDVQHKTVQ